MRKRPTWEKPGASAVGVRQSYRLTSLEALRAAMLAHGYTSGYQLAKASGVGVATVNHLVHGRRATASATTVGKLREVLGADSRDIFELDKSQVSVNQRHAA